MPKHLVFVEVENDKIIRIIKNKSDVWKLLPDRVRQVPKAYAVGEIRNQVFDRSKGQCEDCGRRITKVTGELHERIPKGNGGEVSLANCCFLCYYCHQSRPDAAHGNRRWHPAKFTTQKKEL